MTHDQRASPPSERIVVVHGVYVLAVALCEAKADVDVESGKGFMRTYHRRRLLGRSLGLSAGFLASGFPGRWHANDVLAEGAFDFSSGVTGCSRIALIFNIGSGYEPATGILDTLASFGVPASMFIMGWLAEQNPWLVQQLAAGGHLIGSHGYLPPELTVRSDDDVIWDLQTAAGALNAALGYAPGPWFTPYASASDNRVRSLASSLGLVTVGWSVGSDDWSPDATADSIYSRVVGGAFDGAIVELHLDAIPSVYGTAVALPWIISDLSAQGYQFVTVSQIANWC